MEPERRHRMEALFEAALDRPAAARREWLREVCGRDEELCAGVLRLLRAHARAEGILEGPPPAAALPGTGGDRRPDRRIGVPFLVMEYVAGEPITDYCDRRRLTLERRLRLLVTVARTVHYAHRNLIVHRDLKPSNILVTGEGEIKLLDFGIAKLLDPSAAADVLPQTRPGARLMTPEYASPEQIRGEAITTMTDVYGLGLVLHELLSGHSPVRQRTGGEGERPLPAWAPPRPSSAVRGDAAIGPARGTQPGRLRRRLRGDLDRIVLTALREEPERRYASAEQLAEDIESYLRRKPIRARGDSVPYRVGRFAARHCWGLAVAALFVLLLAGYAATVTVKEREVRAALERAAARAEKLSHQPAAQAQMLDVVGRTYQYLGQYDRAQPPLERAFGLRRGLPGGSGVQVARTLGSLSLVLRDRGEYGEAESLARESLDLRRRALGGEHPEVAQSLHDLAEVLRRQGRYAAAEPLYREALALRRRLLGDEHPDRGHGMSGLALVLRDRGDYAAADSLYGEVLAMRLRLLGGEHPAVATTLNDRGVLMREWGDYSRAEALLLQALRMRREKLAEGHLQIEQSLRHLVTLYERWGRAERASAYREMLGGG